MLNKFRSLSIIIAMLGISCFASASVTPPNEKPSAEDVSPLADIFGYYITKPCDSIKIFLGTCLDDAVEDGAKIGMIYWVYGRCPLAQSSYLRKAAVFPLVYGLSNAISDKLGDVVEGIQVRRRTKAPKGILLGFANDIGEDTAKLGCYLAMIIKGFAPSMATAKFLRRLDLASEPVIRIVKGYAYFSALTKLTTDFQFCEENANLYGDWLEAQVARLLT